MAWPYVPAGSGFAKVADIAPHLCCDTAWTVLWCLNQEHSDSGAVHGLLFVHVFLCVTGFVPSRDSNADEVPVFILVLFLQNVCI